MFVEEVQLFQRIPSHIVDEIAGIATEETFPEGSIIIQQGDNADFLYILEKGAIHITIQGKESISFSVNETGSVLGWSSLVEPRKYTATAKCVKESDVIKIDGDRLLRIFKNHPEEGLTIVMRLGGVIASRLLKCYQQLTALTA